MHSRRRLIVAAAVLIGATLLGVVARRGDGSVDERHSRTRLLARLAALGPFPDDDAVTQAQLDEFFDIVCLIDSDGTPPDPAYVRPLLAAFGYGRGFGGETHGVWALLKQDRATVVAAALDTLDSGRPGPRQWAMETLRRLREGDRGNPPPSAREVQAVEAALRGPELVAEGAVYWAYWVEGSVGRQVLELAAQVATGDARALAAELLAG